MKAFEMVYPESVEQALELLGEGRAPRSGAKIQVLAGGQDLLGELKDHLREPERLVNIKRIAGLDQIEVGPRSVTIGALATIATIAEDARLAERFPVLSKAAASVASPQIRNLGTLGGNLCQRPRCWYYRQPQVKCIKRGGGRCYAYDGLNKHNAILGGGPVYIVHPSDLAPALVSLDAQVTIASAAGERKLALESFFILPSQGGLTRENVLRPNELITRIEIPVKEGWRSTWIKVRERGSFDWALAAVAAALRLEGGRVAAARLCLGGVAPTPWRCASAETLLAGKALEDETIAAVATEALRGAEPLEHNHYKIPLAKGIITRALRELRRA